MREKERDRGREEKNRQKKMSKLAVDMRNATICSLLSGCHADQLRMSRLNRDQNRQWSNKAGWRSAATKKKENRL